MAKCKSCPTELARRNKTGLCRECYRKNPNAVSAETRAKISAGQKRRHLEDPELAERRKVLARKASRSPAAVKARTERWKREKMWERGSQAACRPEVRAKAGKSIRETRLAWCPPHLRDDYIHLIRGKRFSAAEAKRMILEQDAAEVAAVRRRMNYQEPEPEERGPVGRPAVWPDCPEKLRPAYDKLRRKGVPAAEARRELEKAA